MVTSINSIKDSLQKSIYDAESEIEKSQGIIKVNTEQIKKLQIEIIHHKSVLKKISTIE